MADNPESAAARKEYEKAEEKFLSKFGKQVQGTFKKAGDGIQLNREIADAEKNRPELQDYRDRISAEQAAKNAEWAQRIQGFKESLPAKLPGVLGITGACVGFYVIGIPLALLIIAWIVFMLILWFIPGGKVLQFLIILLVIGAVVYFVPVFLPLAQAYAQQNKGAPALKGGIASVTEFTQNMRKQLSNYVDTQIQCASGNCPKGEAEGEYVGIQLSDPEPVLPDKEYKPGEQVTVSTEVSGVNLKVYSSIKATTNCSIIGKEAKSISPKIIPFTDISNNKRTITCTLTTVKTSIGVNTIKTSITFPFNTTSDLPVYVMDEGRRNSMMEMWGRDFLSTHYKIDNDPVAKFNDGPINLGIKVNQVPIAARNSGSDEAPAELVFALFNQWGYYNGEVVSLDNIIITLPNNMELYDVYNDTEACPFTGSGGKYTLSKMGLGNDSNYTIKTVRTFVCGLNVKSMNQQQSFDLFTGHIKITAQYTYRMTSQTDLILKTTSASGSSGIDGAAAAMETMSSNCSNADASNVPAQSYIDAYNTGQFNTDIKNGINAALNEYKPDWLTPDQMRDVLLGMMIEETSMGTAGDDDNDGVPDHIAGCTSRDNPKYVKNSVSGDIICAAERIKSYVSADSYCKDYVNAGPAEKLHCALTTYNGHEEYANKVEADAASWHNYFCSIVQ